MPAIDLSILNQRQTPAFYADTLANRPAAGFVGRIFVSTDTFAFYRDNGTTWDLIGGPGTGTVTGTGANGQVTYWNGASTITGSNDLFFDAVNGHLGIGTITPGTALDVKHDQNTVVQLEQVTATNDNRIAFINNGVGLWRLGAFYNAGANDFGLFDIAAAAQPVTVKRTTGQVLIGTSTVGSGKLVVASATGDNGVQIVGASAPSLRIDNAESGPTKRAGLGISTATNNFIQGSADRDFCMFNGSTTASPILFGIYGTTNVVEAARISAARNFLIGTTTDAGQKLQVNGNALFGALNATTGTFDTGTTVTPGFIVTGGGNSVGGGKGNIRSSDTGGGNYWDFGRDNLTTGNFVFSNLGGTPFMSLTTVTGNLLIGTTTDAGQKLQVSGTAYITGNVSIGQGTPTNKLDVATANKVTVLSTNSAINADYTSANINEYQTIGFSYSSSIGNTSQYWGMGFSATNFANAFGDLFFFTNASIRLRISHTGIINIPSIPTSPVGLSSGDIYSNLGVLTIV